MLCTVQLYNGLQWSSLLIDVCEENVEEEVSPTMVLIGPGPLQTVV